MLNILSHSSRQSPYLLNLYNTSNLFNNVKILNIDPENIIALNNIGNALGKLNRHEDAIECYDKILNIDSVNVNALNDKGFSLTKIDKYENANECYEKVLSINPNKIFNIIK